MPDQTPGEADALVSEGSSPDMPARAGTDVEVSHEATASEPEIVNGRYASGTLKGKFAPGHSGNPGGGHKADKTSSLTKTLEGIIDRGELARSLWHLSQGRTAKGTKLSRPNLSVQLAAIQTIYDRIDGKALQSLRTEGDALAQIIIMHPGRMAAPDPDADATEVTVRDVAAQTATATNGNGQTLLHT